MSQDLFERAARRFDPPIDAWEVFGRRRDRKRRNQRIASGLLALIVAAAAIGGLLAAFRKADQHAPATPSITPGNVSDLTLTWSADLRFPGFRGHEQLLPHDRTVPPDRRRRCRLRRDGYDPVRVRRHLRFGKGDL